MQFACMYGPTHILSYHILPIPGVVLLGVIGAALARRAFRKQRKPVRWKHDYSDSVRSP